MKYVSHEQIAAVSSIRFTRVSGIHTGQLQGKDKARWYPSTKGQCPVPDFHRQAQEGRGSKELKTKKKGNLKKINLTDYATSETSSQSNAGCRLQLFLNIH